MGNMQVVRVYTYAADFIRRACVDGTQIAPGITTCSMSRATASKVRRRIADALGMEDGELARILADAYMRETGTETGTQGEGGE